jgi:hypothetical protein
LVGELVEGCVGVVEGALQGGLSFLGSLDRAVDAVAGDADAQGTEDGLPGKGLGLGSRLGLDLGLGLRRGRVVPLEFGLGLPETVRGLEPLEGGVDLRLDFGLRHGLGLGLESVEGGGEALLGEGGRLGLEGDRRGPDVGGAELDPEVSEERGHPVMRRARGRARGGSELSPLRLGQGLLEGHRAPRRGVVVGVVLAHLLQSDRFLGKLYPVENSGTGSKTAL